MPGKCGLPCGLRSAPLGIRLCKLSAACSTAGTAACKKHRLAHSGGGLATLIELNWRIGFELADRRKKVAVKQQGRGAGTSMDRNKASPVSTQRFTPQPALLAPGGPGSQCQFFQSKGSGCLTDLGDWCVLCLEWREFHRASATR